MAVCCLCASPLPQDHRRKKKFHGASCAIAKNVLSSLSSVGLEYLAETRDLNAILYSNCEKTLTNIHNLERKLDALKADVKQKLSLNPYSSVVRIGKRSSIGGSIGAPAAKNAHLNPSSTTLPLTSVPRSGEEPGPSTSPAVEVSIKTLVVSFSIVTTLYCLD